MMSPAGGPASSATHSATTFSTAAGIVSHDDTMPTAAGWSRSTKSSGFSQFSIAVVSLRFWKGVSEIVALPEETNALLVCSEAWDGPMSPLEIIRGYTANTK